MPTQLNWDDLRIFLSVARHGRFSAAAKALEIDHTTVARRIGTLEHDVGSGLLVRSPKGIALTETGIKLSRYAERIETEVFQALTLMTDTDQVRGTVRLATPEAFGQALIAPNVGSLIQKHPGLTLELAPESRAVSLVNREADISITLTRPQQGRLIARRLTDYKVGLYAARSFLDRSGSLPDLQSAARQPFISYVDNLIELPELSYLQQTAQEAKVTFRSTSITAQHTAVAAGLGIGLLHVYTASKDPRLVRILEADVEITRTYWLTFHEDNRSVPRIRAVLDFIDEIIAENRHRF